MDWGGPEFVLGIIAIATFGGILKTWVRGQHGLPEHEGLKHRRLRHHRESSEAEALRAENARLTDRLEASEERLAVLERIVTDKSYNLASEIEALRDVKIEDRSKVS